MTAMYRKINRKKKIMPRSGNDFCRKCDAAQVREGGKCPVCGQEHPSKKMKVNKSNNKAKDLFEDLGEAQ